MTFRAILIAALVATAPVAAAPALAQSADANHSVKSATVLSRFAIRDALKAQSVFNEARAAGDQTAMTEAAADLVNNLAVAQRWVAELDRRVTASEFSGELDADVMRVLELVDNAYDAVDDFFINDDMAGLGNALDTDAADWLTELGTTGRRVLDEVFAAS